MRVLMVVAYWASGSTDSFLCQYSKYLDEQQ
jgi:hypothetical protein